jgi:hypothetical protein
MRAIVTALNDVRIEPENETERIILLHWSKRKPRVQLAEGAEKDFVNLFMTFDEAVRPPGPPDPPKKKFVEYG